MIPPLIKIKHTMTTPEFTLLRRNINIVDVCTHEPFIISVFVQRSELLRYVRIIVFDSSNNAYASNWTCEMQKFLYTDAVNTLILVSGHYAIKIHTLSILLNIDLKYCERHIADADLLQKLEETCYPCTYTGLK